MGSRSFIEEYCPPETKIKPSFLWYKLKEALGKVKEFIFWMRLLNLDRINEP